MWAGRLRQDGNEFAALGPAQRAAILKGKGCVGKSKSLGGRSMSSKSCVGKSNMGASSKSSVGKSNIGDVCNLPISTSSVGKSKSCRSSVGKSDTGDECSGGSSIGGVERRGSSGLEADHCHGQSEVDGSHGFAGFVSNVGAVPFVGPRSRSPNRADFPKVLPFKKACKGAVFEAGCSVDGRSRMLAAFDRDITAASSKATGCALWTTWMEFHDVWFNSDVPVLPLDGNKIRCISACFKEGAYKGFKNYLSKAKEHHLLAGHEWSPLLDFSAKRACRSVLRGVGAERQSQPFDVCKALDVLGLPGKVVLPTGAPIGWCNLIVIGTFFIMREIELAYAKVAHVKICMAESKVTLLLPVSKKDPRAIGCERSWSCLCRDGGGSRPDCPFHAAVAQLRLLESTFGADMLQSLPLFPDQFGLVADKATVVQALEATVVGYGGDILGPSGARILGGHSFRVTGAQRLAAAGVEIIKVMVLARWSSEVVLRYVKDAPLAGLSEQVKCLEDKKDLVRLLAKAADGAELLGSKLGGIEGRLLGLIADHEAWTRRCELTAARTGNPPFVSNGRAKHLKIHKTSIDGMEFPPYLWRAKCGFRFAFCGFTRHMTMVDFAADQRCAKCFPIEVSGKGSGAEEALTSSSSRSEGDSSS